MNNFICQICYKEFINYNNFIKHIKTHKNGDKLICPICGKEYTTYINKFNEHVFKCKEKSSNNNIFICDICGRECKGKRGLSCHKLAHNKEYSKKRSELSKNAWIELKKDEEKYSNFVNKISKLKTNNTYTKDYIKNNNENCICEICGKNFNNKISLTSHITCAHKLNENKIYICNICGETFFTNIGAFNNHVKNHNIEWHESKRNKIINSWNKLLNDPNRRKQFTDKVSKIKSASIVNSNTRQKISSTLKAYFNNLSDEEYSKVVLNYINAPKKGNAVKHSGKYTPTSIENKIINLNIDGLNYNGNKENNITIRFENKQYKKSVVPDFIYKDGIHFIETFGVYWHPKSDEEKYINAYSSNNLKVLILWEDEINNNFENCITKIEKFLNIKIER